MAVARNLQMRAYNSLQMGPTVQEITRRGRAEVDRLYERGSTEATVAARDNVASGTNVRWWGDDGYLRQIDVQRLYSTAARHDAIIELALRPGQFVRHGDIVLRHSLGPGLGADELLRNIEVGADQTWDQDPLFAFRLLADIGLRAQSPAINDQRPAATRSTQRVACCDTSPIATSASARSPTPTGTFASSSTRPPGTSSSALPSTNSSRPGARPRASRRALPRSSTNSLRPSPPAGAKR